MYHSALGDFANRDAEQFYIQLMQKKSIEQRMQIAMELWQMAVEVAGADVQRLHPTWSTQELRAEVARRIMVLDGTTRFTPARS
jgi:hypothetical protein